jgi:hypothetical protein
LQIASSKKVLGLIRSDLEPEETRGLTRSGDLSRMLPSEAHLMASGWPVSGVAFQNGHPFPRRVGLQWTWFSTAIAESSAHGRIASRTSCAERQLHATSNLSVVPMPHLHSYDSILLLTRKDVTQSLGWSAVLLNLLMPMQRLNRLDYGLQARSAREDGTRRQGSAAARRLFMVRRVERNLMSYERTGERFTLLGTTSDGPSGSVPAPQSAFWGVLH